MSKKIHSQDSNSNWREEYKNTHRVTKRQLELLENGPDSLSIFNSTRKCFLYKREEFKMETLNAMYQQWRRENNK